MAIGKAMTARDDRGRTRRARLDGVATRPVTATPLLIGILLLAGCGGGDNDDAVSGTDTTVGADPTDTVVDEQRHPDVIGAEASRADDGTWTISATLSSPYDTPERYADAWRVLGPDGTEYGVRILLHDHANEQPFTRSQSGIEIPDGVDVVTIEGRDLVHGWGGTTFDLALPAS